MHESYFKMNAKLAYTMGSKNFRSKIPYARHYNQRTEVRFTSFLSGEFITMAVINPPEKKLAERTFVQWLDL